MNNRAQMIGQVFIFVIAGLVFVLILGYGYKAIMGLMEKGEKVQLIDFRNKLDSSINIIKRDYGSVQRVDLIVPSNTDEVCFATSDKNDVRSGEWEKNFQEERQLFYGAWVTGTENVFFVPKQSTPIPEKDIVVDPEGKGYLCVNAAGGRISLRMEGIGSKVLITEWPVQGAE